MFGYTLPYVKQMTSTSSMHEAGHPKPLLWDNLEGWGEEGGGIGGLRIGGGNDTCTPMANSC